MANMVAYQGDVAQLVERGLCKPEVVGSIPIVSTKVVADLFRRAGPYPLG